MASKVHDCVKKNTHYAMVRMRDPEVIGGRGVINIAPYDAL